MDVLMVLIALIGIAVSIASKADKKKAQQKRMAASGKDAAGPKTAVPQSTPNRTSPVRGSSAPSKFPPVEPSKRPAAAGKGQQTKASPYAGTPRYTHVVTSTLEGGHTHTESSMTGEEACPPPKAAAPKPVEKGEKAVPAVGALLDFQTNSVLRGVLYAEILGKPKALQRE